jgi:hypothetical protein
MTRMKTSAVVLLSMAGALFAENARDAALKNLKFRSKSAPPSWAAAWTTSRWWNRTRALFTWLRRRAEFSKRSTAASPGSRSLTTKSTPPSATWRWPRPILPFCGPARASRTIAKARRGGNGVYKSMDAGHTWTHMGLAETHHIGRVVIHPTDPNIVYVAALGHLWGPNKERGVFKTSDGGATWSQSLFINEDTGVSDIAIDPQSPNTLYAAAYERRRTVFGYQRRWSQRRNLQNRGWRSALDQAHQRPSRLPATSAAAPWMFPVKIRTLCTRWWRT